MIYRIDVSPSVGIPDRRGESLLKDIAELNLSGVTSARIIDVYWINGDIDRKSVELLGKELLSDPVTETLAVDEQVEKSTTDRVVLVAPNAGVTDPVEETILKAAADLGVKLLGAAEDFH